MNRYKAVVIGAGVGGLSAAAYLAKAGVETLVIEQTPFPGGRCYSRVVDGAEYDIGALFLGQRVPQILQDVFGVDSPFRPSRIGAKIGDSFFSLPFSRYTLRELRKHQVSWLDILGFLAKIPTLYQRSCFDRYQSVGQVLDSLTGNKFIRQLGYVMFGVSGVSPYHLPSHYLGMGNSATGTIVGNPVHLFGGNKRVADLLVDFILLHGGRLVFQEKVNQIAIKDPHACRVTTDQGEYKTNFVISNADIKTTVLTLTSHKVWNEAYLEEIKSLKRPLQVVNVFLNISPLQKFPAGFGVFLMAEDPIEEFRLLEEGKFPDRSIFILQVPTNLEKQSFQGHRATLQFYHPRGNVAPKVLDRQVHWIMTDGLDLLFPRLSERVTGYTVYDPAKYEREFGLKPFVYGTSPEIGNRRFPLQTPISNLFCVGDSVQPERPSVPQAMESGISCAQVILRRIAGD